MASLIDMSGQRFGRLIVLDQCRTGTYGLGADWLCRCDCGTEKWIRGVLIRNGNSTSCGCQRHETNRSRRVPLTGSRSGKLLVLDQWRLDTDYRKFWLCRCDCGAEKWIRGDSITSGITISCGCHQKRSIEHKKASRRQGCKRRYRKYVQNIQFRLGMALRRRLWAAMRHKSRSGSAVRDLGCSIEELIVWLERQFHPGMTWDNYGNRVGNWNIDHEKPVSAFDLTDRTQFLECCHYTNLRPMFVTDNARKGGVPQKQRVSNNLQSTGSQRSTRLPCERHRPSCRRFE